jgi:cytochrome P450
MPLSIHLFALGVLALILGGGWVFHSVITSSLPTAAPQRQDHRTTVVLRSWDILGIVKISNVFYAAAKGTIIQYLETSWNLYGDTHTMNVLGTKVIFTRNAANIKSIFKNQFDDYDAAKGTRDRVFKHLFPNSIVSTDGHEWRKERGEILPHLSYIGQGLKTETMESSFQILVQRIAEANAIDLQLLVFGFGTDILHEFAVGETLHCMDPQNQSSGERAYADALVQVSSTIVQRLMLGPVAWLLPHKKFKADCNTIRGYFSHVVSKKLSARQGQGDSNDGKEESPLDGTLLNRLLGSNPDPIKLGHNLAMFMMASEPLTAFLSHVIWLLSRNPTVYKDLRKEVLNTVGYQKPTPEQLPKFVFLEKVMNECK